MQELDDTDKKNCRVKQGLTEYPSEVAYGFTNDATKIESLKRRSVRSGVTLSLLKQERLVKERETLGKLTTEGQLRLIDRKKVKGVEERVRVNE